MARLIPTLPSRSAFGAGGYAEIALLDTLEQGLSGAYTLFHSVDWSRGVGQHEQHGEIDIVVVNQAGDVLLIEIKSGPVDFAPGGIFKSYGSHSKNVTGQIGLQYGALRGRLNDAGLGVALHHLLVLPDVQVQTESVQWPRERIVDSGDMDHISTRIAQTLGPGLRRTDTQARVLAFFENRFQVVSDVSAVKYKPDRTRAQKCRIPVVQGQCIRQSAIRSANNHTTRTLTNVSGNRDPCDTCHLAAPHPANCRRNNQESPPHPGSTLRRCVKTIKPSRQKLPLYK